MRFCLCLLTLSLAALAADNQQSVTVRGKLTIHEGQPATLETPDHRTVSLDGDETTRKVLGDRRLNGFELQVKGHFTAAGRFQIDPAHTHSTLVNKDGHLKMVTYWCEVCAIRSYTPGLCVCCRDETTLDLRDPDQP